MMATLLGMPVHAAVSFPDTPIQINNGVPPNIWFILDDSGSMASDFMPDGVPATAPAPNIANQAYTRNTIYYNPRVTYRGWQQADGSLLPSTPYGAAYTSTTLASGGTTNLGNVTRTFYVPTATNTNLADTTQYVRYQFPANTTTATQCLWDPTPVAGFKNCSAVTSFNWGGGLTRSVTDEMANFANWYSYHRTRSKVAKAGASYVFNDPTIFNADNDYRVGFTTIWQRNEFEIPVGNNNGLFRGNSAGQNRREWFDRLFAATASGTTPLIPALSRAGNYFSETGTDGPWGPQPASSQYQCRQNFTILTTDGYWNNLTGALNVGNSDGTADSATDAKVYGPPQTLPPTPDYLFPSGAPYADTWTNTLADVAMHFWKRDLRTDLSNIVPASASNPAFWQHMVTFGISIGLRGTLDPDTDMAALRAGTLSWPNPMDVENLERIDDLFHASVNGHGEFVSASDPAEFAEGLGDALRAIAERRGSGSNASVASTSTSSGTKLFQAKFFSGTWFGELLAYPVTSTGIGATESWSATIPAASSRNIFTYSGLVGAPGTTFPTASQSTALTAPVVDYLRGERNDEPQFTAGALLRNRRSVLGDIANSSPAYVKGPGAVETVYIGANDGMMHAFNAADGTERFAYVPGGLNLSHLKDYSDPDYGHHFFVDGPIVTSTSREISNRTILVGTLGRGGKGLYALDVTDPENFAIGDVLWDTGITSDDKLGYILSKPIISKLNNGSIGVIVPNGLNSDDETSVLLVYDLLTGAKLAEIDTGVGSNNGLSAPRGWDSDLNGTVDIVYAGDFRGNVWKFDLSDNQPSNWDIADGRPLYQPTGGLDQPITGGISIAVDPSSYKRWVFFGTGRLLTTSDLTNTSRQSWYGVIDDASNTAALRRSDLTAREIVQLDGGTLNRAFEPNSPLPGTSKGWYIDLDTPPTNLLEGERMVGEPQVIAGNLVAPSIIPSTSNPCFPGRGYINAVDAFTGTSVTAGFFDANGNGNFTDDTLGPSQTPIGSIDLGVGMVTDPAVLDKLIIAGGSLARTGSIGIKNPVAPGRISWREILRD